MPLRTQSDRLWFAVAGIMICVFVAGCGSDVETVTAAESIQPPDSFEDGGKTWTRDSDSKAEENRLVRYFQQNPSLAENPLIDDLPHIYRSGSKSVRYYWTVTLSGHVRWVRLDRKGGQFSDPREGTGFPFESGAKL